MAAFSAIGLAQSAAPQSAAGASHHKSSELPVAWADAIKVDFPWNGAHCKMPPVEPRSRAKRAAVEIDAQFDGLDDPTKVRAWNISRWCCGPSRRKAAAVNLGETGG